MTEISEKPTARLACCSGVSSKAGVKAMQASSLGIILLSDHHREIGADIVATTSLKVCLFRKEDDEFCFEPMDENFIGFFPGSRFLSVAICAIIASPEDCLLRKDLIDRIPQGSDVPYREVLSPLDSIDWRWLANSIAIRSRSIARVAANIHQSLAELRQRYDDLQLIATKMERFLLTHVMPPEIMIWGPKQAPTHTAGETEIDGAWQGMLPIQSLGLCRIDLWVANEPVDVDDALHVTLTHAGSAELLASWHLIPAGSENEWRTLRLKRSLDMFGAQLMLRIQSKASSGWKLIADDCWLRPPNSVTDTVAAANTKGIFIRLYATIPGIESDGNNCQNGKLLRLMPDKLSLATELEPSASESAFMLVGLSSEYNGLIVHPQRDKPTVAKLDCISPPGATMICLRVLHAQPAGEPFEITALTSISSLSSTSFARHTHLAGIGPEKWAVVESGSRANLTFTLSPTTKKGETLYIATRPVEGRTSDGAWAVVENVEFLSYEA